MVSNAAFSHACVPGIVPINNSSSASAMNLSEAPSFAKIPLNSFIKTGVDMQTSIGVPAVKISLGDAECEIYNGADHDVVERVLLTL